MNALWRRYAARFDALTLRERVMVFAAVMVALVALTYTLLVEPQLVKQKRLNSAILQKHSEMKTFEAQVGKLIGSGGRTAERDRLGRLRGELDALEGRISAEERRFTAPSQMRGVIESLLARHRGVTLVEMKTLAVGTLSAADKPAAKASGERLIYRHGLELTVTGSYLELLGYVRDLEKLPTQLYWSALDLDAASYPRLSMKLTVYTLSLDPTWLNV